MFKQVKSPAYGTGISANLVSNEERQRYNYGGRVKAQNSLYVDDYWIDPAQQSGWMSGYDTWEEVPMWIKNMPFSKPTWENRQQQKLEETQGNRNLPGGEHDLFNKYEDVTEEEVISPSGTRAMKEKEFSGEIDSSPDAKFLQAQNTTDIDTDPFAFLDENIEAKKKLGRGAGLMKAAAAAVKWGGAPTAEKRAAAVSEGLTGFGDEASKATLGAMDLQDRAKILAATQGMKDEAAYKRQELKGDQTEAIWDKRIAAVKRDPNKTDLQRFQELMDLPGGQTGQGIAKALRAVLGGKRGVEDSIDITDVKRVAEIPNGTIIVSLEGRVGVKDDSKVGSNQIDWSIGVEEILEG